MTRRYRGWGSMNIPISSPLAYIGFLLVALGGFMVLAGLGIISLQQVSVRPGTATTVIGVVFAVIGLGLLYPEVVPSRQPSTPKDSSANTRAEQRASEAPRNEQSISLGSDWNPLRFSTKGAGLWSEPSDGAYEARGAADTVIWSEETVDGDFELEVEISSPSSQGEALVIIYGDGESMAAGCLVFGVASDYQKIMADTVYEDGSVLGFSERIVDFGGSKQSHLMGIRIADRKATLTLDGTDVATAVLSDEVSSGGRVGLYKYAGRPDVTFSNVRVRQPD